MKRAFKYIILLCLISSCSTRSFPEEIILTNNSSSEIVSTLEENLTPDLNSLFCPTFLQAINELKSISKDNKLGNPKNSEVLNRILMSSAHVNAMAPEDLSISKDITSNEIRISVEFRKSLSFETNFDRNKKELIFDSIPVEHFGCSGFNRDASKQLEVLFYKDSDEFALKILPESGTDELILFKPSNQSFSTLNQAIKLLDKKVAKHAAEPNKKFQKKDTFLAPVLAFNYKKYFSKLIGETVEIDSNPYSITEANQSIAFLLDESGAEIKSQSVMALEKASEKEIPEPRKFIFNGDFLLLVKKYNSSNPYLVCWVSSSDIMLPS